MMRADIFCRVIDNFGDIGVAWRLARQLNSEHDWSIRLWVDDLQSFEKLEPRVRKQPSIDGIEIVHWTNETAENPADVAIAMFSCDLPATYLEKIKISPIVWINLEYLSAENWVESCHALPSLRSDGLSSYFYFPGFTLRTGGLLREVDLITRRNEWLDHPAAQLSFLKSLGISTQALEAWQGKNQQHKAKLISLFCYPNAPIHSAVDLLTKSDTASVLLIPKGIAPHLQTSRIGNLFIERIPFVPQIDYDKILWTCDLNFVRGEDSVVRAIWAGKPFIWQIYSQTENTHLFKLDAWLARSGLPQSVGELFRSWNPPSDESRNAPDQLSMHATDQDFSKFFRINLANPAFENWQAHASRLTETLLNMPELASSLDRFVRNKLAS